MVGFVLSCVVVVFDKRLDVVLRLKILGVEVDRRGGCLLCVSEGFESGLERCVGLGSEIVKSFFYQLELLVLGY